jgi:hypothetical protein
MIRDRGRAILTVSLYGQDFSPMDIDFLLWLVGGFWVGALVGFAGCAMMRAGCEADMRRARGIRQVLSASPPFPADLQPDNTVPRF